MSRIAVLAWARTAPQGRRMRRALLLSTAVLGAAAVASMARADETCQSPYMAKITGE